MEQIDTAGVFSLWWRGNWSKLCVALVAVGYFIYYAATPHEWHFIDNVNLLIHEAGHVVFSPFGSLLYILGGSLLQIVFPLPYIFYFYRKQQYFSASLLMFWVGQNLINVSVYASDAVAMQLPLLGGDTSGHDWHNLLSMTHLLPYTPYIGGAIYGAGICVVGSAAVASLVMSQALDTELKKSSEFL